MNKLLFWFKNARAYSFPTAITAWLIPFTFALFDNGNILFGFMSLVGIIFVLSGVNLFDDFIDYLVEFRQVKSGKKPEINLQKGKCEYLINKTSSLKELFFVLTLFFLSALIIGIFLWLNTGNIVLYIIFISAIISISYPFLSFVALGEVAIAIMYSPLLFSGVYFVMTKTLPDDLYWISVSTGLLTVSLSHAHTLLDYDLDIKNKKITLCSLAKSKKQAVLNQIFIISLAYINIITFSITYKQFCYLLSLLSLPTAIVLIKLLQSDSEESIIQPNVFFGFLENLKQYKTQANYSFIVKFMVARNLMVEFSIFIIIAKILTEQL